MIEVDFDKLLEEIQVKKFGEAESELVKRVSDVISLLEKRREYVGSNRIPTRITIILLVPHEE